MSSGVHPISTLKQSLATGTVVAKTKIENTYVQIGSNIIKFLLHMMITAEIITPTDCSKSPII
jgi:hypothetical protein